jgi:predicted transcriptional regulator
MGYRTRSEIAYSILAAARQQDGVTKMQLMFLAYLTYDQVKEYLVLLLGNGLLERDLHSDRYQATTKGSRLVETCQTLMFQ